MNPRPPAAGLRLRCRGFALLELGVALTLLLVAIGVGVTALSSTLALKRAQDRRAAAREAVLLGLERVRALDPRGLPAPGQTIEMGIVPELAPRLPQGRCALTATPEPGAPRLIRVCLTVSWSGSKEVETGQALLRVAAPRGSASGKVGERP